MAGERGKEAAVRTADGADAALIDWRERDHELNLHEDNWGQNLPAAWTKAPGEDRYFSRPVQVSDTPGIEIAEHLLRFPSVPIYGINRKAEYNIQFSQRPNMHTLRLLRSADSTQPVTRVFVLHNGLNETRNLRFYYQLASWILNEDKECGHRSACLIAPFPGHLMHAPFPGPFAETPLSRYLRDSGELFRQFLRYMVEMRWILGLLRKRKPESWMVGGEPLSRESLASSITAQFTRLRDASFEVWKARRFEKEFDQDTIVRLIGKEIDPETTQSSLDSLSEVMGLTADDSPPSLPVHVVGYSLGGFLAQCVFFAWPNLVSSCATICSGGAIRALSPTAFAHAEEWQAVLHTLRPELEDSMLNTRILRSPGHISGLEIDQFDYYQRIFDQVFLQEDKASYKARLSEYGTRLLFVSGGEDPIVRTREVLDASPTEGITMLSVASLTHFLGEEPINSREVEQREFWLPEAGGLIGRSAARAELLHRHENMGARKEHRAAQAFEKRRGERNDEPVISTTKRPRQRDLASPEFEEALNWVVDGVTSKVEASSKGGQGWLFICRSSVPAALLGAEMRRAWATGLHHHDMSIQRYASGLARRALFLEDEIADRMTILLPSGLERTFTESSGGLVDPHSDAPGYLTTGEQREDAWNEFIDKWDSQARWLDAGPVGRKGESGLDEKVHKSFAQAASRWQRVPAQHLAVNHLPDVWISVDCLNPGFEAGDPDAAIAKFVGWVTSVLAQEPPVPLRSSAARTAKSDPGKALEKELANGRVRIVRVSGAELNPRYRGRFEQGFWPSLTLLAHCAAALVRSGSKPVVPENF